MSVLRCGLVTAGQSDVDGQPGCLNEFDGGTIDGADGAAGSGGQTQHCRHRSSATVQDERYAGVIKRIYLPLEILEVHKSNKHVAHGMVRMTLPRPPEHIPKGDSFSEPSNCRWHRGWGFVSISSYACE